ncbi:hypothetical protein MMC17_003355 [Xylographa soralifera]|nr:hypothetical protein [Xylographa soralifera]
MRLIVSPRGRLGTDSTNPKSILQKFFYLAAWQLLETHALPSIEVVNQYFVNPSTQGQFQVVGIEYAVISKTASDSLSDHDACLRDAALLQRLGINTIHVPYINTSLSHDQCVSIFDAVGIYICVDLTGNMTHNTPMFEAINASSLYTIELIQNMYRVIDAFKDYENVLGFWVGNAIFGVGQSFEDTPGYLRAIVRDAKEYIARNAARKVPVGYDIDLGEKYFIASEWESALYGLGAYTQCIIDNDASDLSRADFSGFWDFHWCPGSGTRLGTNGTFDQQWSSSGWQAYAIDFKFTNIPTIFSLYGCTNQYAPEGRDFHDASALYNPAYMATTFSGGVLNQWTLVTPDDAASALVYLDSEGNAQLKKDYETFSSVLHQFNLQDLRAGSPPISATSADTIPCSSIYLGQAPSALFDANWTLPTPPSGVQDLILYGNNGTTGRLVPVTQTDVTYTVQDASGSTITGLSITISAPVTAASLQPSSNLSSIVSPQTGNSNNALKLGAGIGIPFLLLLSAILGGFVCLRLRRIRSQATANSERQNSRTDHSRELECTTYAGQPELHDRHRPHELDYFATFLELNAEDFGRELY